MIYTEYVARAVIENMVSDDVVNMWNEYCESHNYMDDYVFPMDYFDEEFRDTAPSTLASMIVYGGYFHVNDNYFYYDGYGNIRSFDYYDEYESPIDVDALCGWLLDMAEGGQVEELVATEIADWINRNFDNDGSEDIDEMILFIYNNASDEKIKQFEHIFDDYIDMDELHEYYNIETE